MRLRQLFEDKNKEVAIIFGRFNPPHKGHRAAWEMAAQSPVWYVGTNKSTQGPKDPLPYDIKVEAMETIWPAVADHIIAETSWLTLASLVYKKHGDVTLLCLTDEDWVTKTIRDYNGKEGQHGYYNFKTIEQKPTPRLSSATALRTAVQNDDRDAFADAAGVPADTRVAGKPFFDLVAEYLMPYANAPKKVAKKKKEPEVAEGSLEANSQDPVVVVSDASGKILDKLNLSVAAKKYGLGNPSTIKQQLAHQDFTKIKNYTISAPMSGQPTAEEAAGVGTITKQNTTKDVNKGTLRKMMKGYKLI